jgi:hypothetical protein
MDAWATIREWPESAFRALKPARKFDAEVSSVLLNRILNVFRSAGVEVLLVEEVVNAGG